MFLNLLKQLDETRNDKVKIIHVPYPSTLLSVGSIKTGLTDRQSEWQNLLKTSILYKKGTEMHILPSISAEQLRRYWVHKVWWAQIFKYLQQLYCIPIEIQSMCSLSVMIVWHLGALSQDWLILWCINTISGNTKIKRLKLEKQFWHLWKVVIACVIN